MGRIPLITFLLLTLLLESCKDSTVPQGGLVYYPDLQLLKKGVVWKYYFTIKEDNSDHPKTNLRFRKMRLHRDTLIIDDFDAESKPLYSNKVLLSGQQWKVLEQQYYDRQELAVPYTILDSVMINWEQSQAELTKEYSDSASSTIIKDVQLGWIDTTIDNRSARIFNGRRNFRRIFQGDTTIMDYTWENRYVKGLGMTSFASKSDQLTITMELVEILPLQFYEESMNDGLQRVGYIDTTQVLDHNSGFNICDSFDNIHDYYNGEPAGLAGGKGRLWRILRRDKAPPEMGKESGYLTYRFVINCEGKAGWFVTEEAGLDFRPKSFPKPVVTHYYQLLQKEKDWNPLVIRSSAADAYAYITFKLKDGEIIEILP